MLGVELGALSPWLRPQAPGEGPRGSYRKFLGSMGLREAAPQIGVPFSPTAPRAVGRGFAI